MVDGIAISTKEKRSNYVMITHSMSRCQRSDVMKPKTTNWQMLSRNKNPVEYREHYLDLSFSISQLMRSIEEKENEILSISDRLIELLAEKSTQENKAQYARAREKRTRLRDECVELKVLVRQEDAQKEWLLQQAKMVFMAGANV